MNLEYFNAGAKRENQQLIYRITGVLKLNMDANLNSTT